MKNKKLKPQEGRFLLLYTVLFILTAALVFFWFPLSGKRMVWKGDGLSQHYLALCYYARWGKTVLGSLFSGRPAFPTFNIHMGFGSDLFTTLQYYVIGDPFSLPAVFVPQSYMLEFHDAMILLRMYLAGLCFDGYCRTMGHEDLTGNLCGSLVYVFSTFALFGMRHPYFLNAMVWFPLLLTGAERILRGSRGRLFTIAVFLACISNFYFFYMLVLLTVVYVLWRTLRICLQYTNGLKVIPVMAGRFFSRGVLGSAMGACFLLPILLRFTEDPRASGGTDTGLFYPLSYYVKLPEALVSFGTDTTLDYWTCFGLGGIGLVCVLLLFMDGDGKKRCTDLKLAFAGMLLMTMIPFAGTVLNGFSYPSNRWTWAFAMFAGYATAVMVPALSRISWKKAALLLLCIILYATVCYMTDAHRSTYPDFALAAVAILASVFLRGQTRNVASASAGAECTSKDCPAAKCPAAGNCLSADSAAIDCPAAESSGTECPAAENCPAGACPAAGCPSAGKTIPESTAGGSTAGGSTADGSTADGSAENSRRNTAVSVALSMILLTLVIGDSALHACVDFIPGRSNSSLEEYHSAQYIEAMEASDAAGMKSLFGNDYFYRYSGRNLANNFSLLYDVSNTQYYWSLSDNSIERFFTETGQGNGMVHLYDNLDNRTMTDEIAGVRYYIRGDGSLLPFGYEKREGLHFDNRELFPNGLEKSVDELFPNGLEKSGDKFFPNGLEKSRDEHFPIFSFSVYENKYALPLGFTCTSYLSRETYDGLTIPQRQEALIQGILLEEEGIRNLQAAAAVQPVSGEEDREAAPALKEIKGDALSFTGRVLPNKARAEEGIEILQNDEAGVCFAVRDTDKAVFLENLEETAGCETSVLFIGTEYTPLPDAPAAEQTGYSSTEPVEIKVRAKRDGKTVSSKKVSYSLPDNPWSTGRRDFMSCCGYSDSPLSALRLKFSRPGIYSFRSLQVVCQPMEDYPARAEALREYAMQETDLHELAGSGATDRITGKVALPERRLLCLQIPRCRGMRAFVDGHETELLQADTMFSALLLEAGTHEIELRYRTPGLAAGAAVSAIALVIFFAVLCRRSGSKGSGKTERSELC